MNIFDLGLSIIAAICAAFCLLKGGSPLWLSAIGYCAGGCLVLLVLGMARFIDEGSIRRYGTPFLKHP